MADYERKCLINTAFCFTLHDNLDGHDGKSLPICRVLFNMEEIIMCFGSVCALANEISFTDFSVFISKTIKMAKNLNLAISSP